MFVECASHQWKPSSLILWPSDVWENIMAKSSGLIGRSPLLVMFCWCGYCWMLLLFVFCVFILTILCFTHAPLSKSCNLFNNMYPEIFISIYVISWCSRNKLNIYIQTCLCCVFTNSLAFLSWIWILWRFSDRDVSL